jgi:hypothetical protein
MSLNVPIFSVFCIDFKYDNLTANFFQGIGLLNSYFAATAAGATLPFGYKYSCSELYKKGKCNTSNDDMTLLRDSLVKNLDIALTLKPIEQIYLLNHQDCGAIKAFLGCSGYPTTLGANNPKEIEINEDILKYANKYMSKKYMSKKFKGKTITLGLIDINGTVAEYNTSTKKWTLVFTGAGTDLLNLKNVYYNL